MRNYCLGIRNIQMVRIFASLMRNGSQTVFSMEQNLNMCSFIKFIEVHFTRLKGDPSISSCSARHL